MRTQDARQKGQFSQMPVRQMFLQKGKAQEEVQGFASLISSAMLLSAERHMRTLAFCNTFCVYGSV